MASLLKVISQWPLATFEPFNSNNISITVMAIKIPLQVFSITATCLLDQKFLALETIAHRFYCTAMSYPNKIVQLYTATFQEMMLNLFSRSKCFKSLILLATIYDIIMLYNDLHMCYLYAV